MRLKKRWAEKQNQKIAAFGSSYTGLSGAAIFFFQSHPIMEELPKAAIFCFASFNP
jgi:hypothetical protein